MRADERGAGAPELRGHNLALVLRLIAAGPPVSRVALAARTGLTKATVSSLVSELAELDLVADIGAAGAATTGGRPASLLVPGELGPLAIGLQTGPDHVGGCLLDLGGRIRARELRPLAAGPAGPRELARTARPVLGSLLAAAVDQGRLVAGIGAAVPGVVRTVDPDGAARELRDAVVAWSPPLGWRDADLQTALAATTTELGAAGVPVWIGNDAALAARAELRDHPVPGVLLYVGGESELGAAICTDGIARPAPRIGGSGFGHVPLRPRGPRCPCGAYGCLDRYAGLGAVHTPPPFSFGRRPAAAAPERRAVAAAADALGAALTPVLAVLDPDRVLLGGRLGRLGPDLLDPLRDKLSALLPGVAAVPPVTAGALGPDAAMRGAALAVLDRILAAPVSWAEGLD